MTNLKYTLRQWISTLAIAVLILPVTLQLSSCSKSDAAIPEDVAERDLLISSEKVGTLSAAALKQLAGAYAGSFQSQIRYDVAIYKVNYRTTFQGRETEASGLVALPMNLTAPAPVLSVQHGTIFEHDEAPSAMSGGLTGFEVFASGGYITLIPDYLGFGASRQLLHPYYHQQSSGIAVVDLIKAAKSLYAQEGITDNGQLFLAGYSEGGYVTLAAQKEIETNPQHGLKITASGAGAGGYDLTEMLADVVAGKPYTYPAYLAYVLMSYNKTYEWNRPLTDFYQDPYATRLATMFNGQHSGGAINKQLTTQTEQLFTTSFLEGLRSDGEQALKKALQENSFNSWVPQSPTRLYHGTADVIVPYANSKQTYERMKAAGAPNLELIPIQNGTHGSSLIPMLTDLIPWMQLFRANP
ncbi:lipase family protein [Pontibacter sp. HSC-36F09]|uniref:lipase family protein n=1 Tax=Pontibacter sp. HSC-36F09 TaxID=2910966 RepID=UPI0020A22BB5|nr:lipase family protein [Pontibacter sp. HSC-36F09]MCP2043780.1 pimeloyl-ACP methyl ester carboxylesterase [Pontibacter sp. HSC-36F09]